MNLLSPEGLKLLPLLVPPLLLSLTLHEFAHARIALLFGDPTALRAGRVTLNPLKHLDPIGTLMLLFVGFGWARPVPVNPFNLHPRRAGEILVSLAGPLTNLCLAILAGCLLRVYLTAVAAGAPAGPVELIVQVLLITLAVNVCLFTFNLLPIFPLDGHHILRELLPPGTKANFMAWQMRYGPMLLIALLAGPGLLSRLTSQPVPDPLGWVLNHVMTLAMQMI